VRQGNTGCEHEVRPVGYGSDMTTGPENQPEGEDLEHQDQDAEPTTKAPDEAAPDVPTGGNDGSEHGGR
jgi:hypothetical protein